MRYGAAPRLAAAPRTHSRRIRIQEPECLVSRFDRRNLALALARTRGGIHSQRSTSLGKPTRSRRSTSMRPPASLKRRRTRCTRHRNPPERTGGLRIALRRNPQATCRSRSRTPRHVARRRRSPVPKSGRRSLHSSDPAGVGMDNQTRHPRTYGRRSHCTPPRASRPTRRHTEIRISNAQATSPVQ